MTPTRPWQVDAYTLREAGDLLCYCGNERGMFVRQQDAVVACGEFVRPGWETPIHLASFYRTAEHLCGSPEAALERVIEMTGLRKPLYLAQVDHAGWADKNRDLFSALQGYQGLDAMVLSLRSRLQFYGSLSDGQTRALRRIIWKLKSK